MPVTKNEAGVACVGDPPIPVWQVTLAWMRGYYRRNTPGMPTLTARDYYDAGSYFSEHMDEINAAVEANSEFCFQQQNSQSQEDAGDEEETSAAGATNPL
jgi:hypothetical protein